MTGKARRGPTWISPSNSSTRDLQRRAGLPLISALHEPQWAALQFHRAARAGACAAWLAPARSGGGVGAGAPRARRAAVGRRAVPPAGGVRGLRGLDAQARVEDDHALDEGYL